MRIFELVSVSSNILASALLISVNKVLLSTKGFVWSCTLSGLHFASTAAFSYFSTAYYAETSAQDKTAPVIPPLDLFFFTTVSVVSIAGSQLSLKLNSVGFFQISKLGQIALTCLLERILLSKRPSLATSFSILVVLSGIYITCIGTVVVTTGAGVVVACVAVFAASMQQLSVATLQTRYCLTPNDLVAQTFYLQAIVLVIFGPFVDWVLVESFPTSWLELPYVARQFGHVWLLLSCTTAIFVNYSQIVCIKHLSPSGFQVLGNAKTVCILFLGYICFDGKVSTQTLCGQGVAVVGMFLYGASAAKKV